MLEHPALNLAKEQFGSAKINILLIESESRARRLPYQRKKLVLLFSAMRHYAARLRAAGLKVDYRVAPNTTVAIEEHLQENQPVEFWMMAASEFGGRNYQQSLESLFDIAIKILPNTQFLTGRFDPIPNPDASKRYVQEQFYRKMRQHYNLLMQNDGTPMGGTWNFDKSNRRSLPKGIQPPELKNFEPDATTLAVMKEVDRKYQGVGQVAGFELAVTHEQAWMAAQDFFDHRLSDFGAYEDAMSSAHDTVFHSRLSPYINIGLLDPLVLAKEAQKRYLEGQAPINSVEGFIRQLVGWREFIYWQYWRLMPEIVNSNFWQADRSLPEMFWNGNTSLNCLQHVIQRALQSGYTHHIERLMIISNFCLLAGIDPAAVNAWFLSAFVDAYEWVMYPNVFGMGLYADGGLIATKPYIASANYIHKMSDYCRSCVFDRKLRIGENACPFNYLYWNFILKHEELLRANPRMARSLLGLKHFDEQQRQQIKYSASQFLESLI